MNRIHNQILKEIFILTVLYTLLMFCMTIGYKSLTSFICRYYNRIYWVLHFKYKKILALALFLFCLIIIILFLPFYPYKGSTLFKYEKINIGLLFKLLFFSFFISSSIYILLNLNFFIEISKKFIYELVNNISFLYNKITIAQRPIPFKINIPELISKLTAGLMMEEIIFRGIIYTRLKKISPIFISNFISSVLFGFYHLHTYNFGIDIIYLSIYGSFFAYIYEKTKNIYASFFVHSIGNIFIIVIMPMMAKYLHAYIALIIYFIIFIAGIIIAIQEIKKYLKVRKTFNLVQSASLLESEK